MSNSCKVSGKRIFAWLFIPLFTVLTLQINASHKNHIFFFSSLTDKRDTVPPAGTKPVDASDTTRNNSDTGRTKVFSVDSIKISKDSLDAPISYSAEDSGVLIIPTKQFYLYGKAHTEYTDLQLDAGVIRYDQNTQIVVAYGSRDTGNNPLDKPTLVQAGSTSISDTIMYNLRTRKGLTKNTFYNEGEIFVNTAVAKTVQVDGDNVVYAYRNFFTTCNLDTPHFAFRTKKMKLIANKLAVSGPAHPEFEGVPVPIYLPFGIYPMKRGRHSGLIAPQFTSNDAFGLGIEGLGYYKVFNDYIDVVSRVNLYSYGGWNLNVNPKYYRRYRYNGSLDFSYQHTRQLVNDPKINKEFLTNNSFRIGWYHSRDSRARPGTTFSASVNAGSTRFNELVPNNNLVNFQNQLNSTIQWSKQTERTNLTVAANHDQNNLSRQVNLRLPNVNYSVLTFYPFQKKERVGSEKWYEKLGIAYEGSLQNQISFYDTAFSAKQLLDTLQWGINHRIPISLALPALGPVNISPSISYEERWLGRSVTYNWNSATKTVDTFYSKGFYTARDMSMGISANTRIFGTYQFRKTAAVQAIRHEIRPSIGLSYKPDLASKYFKTVQMDTSGNKLRYSQYDVGLYPAFTNTEVGGTITYGLDNLLELKVRDRKSEGDSAAPATKKLRLIDGFGFSGGYNFVADSFQWSNINFYLRSTLSEHISVTANANLDPYKMNAQGFRTRNLAWKTGSIGTFTNGGVAISGNFQSKKGEQQSAAALPQDNFVSPDEQQRMLEYVRSNPAEFTDFNIPWTLQTSFSYNFIRVFEREIGKYRTISTANIYLNGDFSLSPKWKIGGSTYYDFRTKEIQTLDLFVTRDMHCWQLAINITPVGRYRAFTIRLNPKSGLLRDLRINRHRMFTDG